MPVAELIRVPRHDMDKSQFGRKLRELRTRAGLSQAALAESLGVPQSAISQWESGIHSPAVTDIPTIADALGVEPGELFKPPAPPPRPRRCSPSRRWTTRTGPPSTSP